MMPPTWGMILIRVFMKKKLILAQIGTTRDILFRKLRDNKDDLSSYQNTHH
jgi:hypothetical protein